MSVLITKYPKRTITSGAVSKWVALHNPIIFEMQRRDYVNVKVFEYASLSPSRIRVKLLSAVTSPDSISVDDYIYLKAGTLYDVVGKVTVIISATEFVLDVAFAGNATAGFINLNTVRDNYRLQVDILGVRLANYFVIGSSMITPNANGLMKVDIHEWVKELAGYANDYDYSTLNVKDENLSGHFNIRFLESWENNDTEVIRDAPISETNRHYFVNAAKQVSDTYGQNMGVYVPVSNVGADLAKWLIGSERPTVFKGYPFDLQFIYSNNINIFKVFRVTSQKDLNGTTILGMDNEIELDAAGSDFVNRLALPSFHVLAKTISCYLQIYIADLTKMADYGYADDYATDYDEKPSTPPIPAPPIEL